MKYFAIKESKTSQGLGGPGGRGSGSQIKTTRRKINLRGVLTIRNFMLQSEHEPRTATRITRQS
jgi:hypothetical protein